MTREDVKNFLIKQQGNTKEEVLGNFASWAVTNGLNTNDLGKVIQDLRSYQEWQWGE